MDDALEAPPDPHRWIILALVCALALAGNYLQYQITALGVVLMVRLHLDITSFSFLFLAPMVVAVVLGIPLGCAGDRFGPKRVVATGFFVSFVGAVIRLLWLDSFAMQYVGMLLIGVGMCALASNYLKVLGCWFGLDTDRAVGIYYASSCLGIVIAQSSTAFLASIEQAYGIGAALLGVLLLLWCAFGSSEPSVSHERKSVLEATGASAQQSPFRGSFRRALSNSGVWLLALSAEFILSATTAFAGFLPQALEVSRGYDSTQAGMLAALVTLASIFGALAGPPACRLFPRQTGGMTTLILAGAICMAAPSFAPNGSSLIAVLALNGFTTAMAGPVVQASVLLLPEIGKAHAGSASGIVATVSIALTSLLPLLAAMVCENDYHLNFIVQGCLLLIAAVPLRFVRLRQVP